MGFPVTARIDSAAPPRPSPSMRVSTMPEMPILVVEALGEPDGVLAGQCIGDEQGFVRPGELAHLARFGHQLAVDVLAAGGIEHDDVDSRPVSLPASPAR